MIQFKHFKPNYCEIIPLDTKLKARTAASQSIQTEILRGMLLGVTKSSFSTFLLTVSVHTERLLAEIKPCAQRTEGM